MADLYAICALRSTGLIWLQSGLDRTSSLPVTKTKTKTCTSVGPRASRRRVELEPATCSGFRAQQQLGGPLAPHRRATGGRSGERGKGRPTGSFTTTAVCGCGAGAAAPLATDATHRRGSYLLAIDPRAACLLLLYIDSICRREAGAGAACLLAVHAG
jgi:hypothetical protein